MYLKGYDGKQTISRRVKADLKSMNNTRILKGGALTSTRYSGTAYSTGADRCKINQSININLFF